LTVAADSHRAHALADKRCFRLYDALSARIPQMRGEKTATPPRQVTPRGGVHERLHQGDSAIIRPTVLG
jgi:hypothetical protein